MKRFTVIWNKHGAGKLVGVFDNNELVEKIKTVIHESDEKTYIALYDIEVNEINMKALQKSLRDKLIN